MNLNWLVTGHGPMFNNVPARSRKLSRADLIQVPVVSEVAAGLGLETFEIDGGEELTLHKSILKQPGPYIAFQVVGQSMAPYIAPGDLAVVTTSWHDQDLNNRILAFRAGGGLTLKRFYLCDDRSAALLLPLNPNYEIRAFHEDDPDYIVIGLLLIVIRYF